MAYLCFICKSGKKISKYPLQCTNSIHSNTPLKSLIENICDISNLYKPNSYICEQCYSMLNEMDALKIRLLEISKQLKCFIKNHSNVSYTLQHNEVDDEVFSSVQVIKKPKDHIIKGEPSDETSNKLHKLNYSQPLKISEQLNERSISQNQLHPYICEICGQGFKHKTNFNIHVKIHKGINPFTCIHCKKSFTQKVALVRHVPIHTGEKPFQCEECGKRFIHHSSFNMHKLSHTGEKNYKCACCGLSFMSSSHVKRHLRIHTGEKKFPCSVCGKQFAERYNLNAHQKLHHDQKTRLLKKSDYSFQIRGEYIEKKLKLENYTAEEHISVM